MTTLILIRHAPTQPDATISADQWQLTADSQALCSALAIQLTEYNITRLITSHEHKAKQTGKYVADTLGSIAISEAGNLHETERKSKTFYNSQDDFREAVVSAMQNPDELLFGDETFSKARQRFSDAIQQIVTQYPDETIGVVSHGRILAMYLATLMSQSPVSIWQQLKMPAYAVLDWEAQTVTKIIYQIEGHPHD